MLTVNQIGVDLVKAWEGIEDGDPRTVRLDPYMDPVGIWTIGYGEALLDERGGFLRGPRHKSLAYAKYPRGLSMDEAEGMLRRRLNDIAEKLHNASVFGTQAQTNAFVSLAYNIGIGSATGQRNGFLGSTLLRMHRNGDPMLIGEITPSMLRTLADLSKEKAPPKTIAHAFSSWSYAGGKWMLGLFRRRIAEYCIYRGDALDVALSTVRGFHG